MPIVVQQPNVTATGSITIPMTVPRPTVNATGDTSAPAPVELPAPEFETWEEASAYLRQLQARRRYVTGRIDRLQEAVAQARILVQNAQTERQDLTKAFEDVMKQVPELA